MVKPLRASSLDHRNQLAASEHTPYTPNSGLPRSTVDEVTQAKYLTEYYRIAYQTGCVERVYWWQLVNPGYGLADHREGKIRKMPSFHAFANLFKGAILSE